MVVGLEVACEDFDHADVFAGFIEVAFGVAVVDAAAVLFADDASAARGDRIEAVWVVAVMAEDAIREEFVDVFAGGVGVFLEADHGVLEEAVFGWVVAELLGVVDGLEERKLANTIFGVLEFFAAELEVEAHDGDVIRLDITE